MDKTTTYFIETNDLFMGKQGSIWHIGGHYKDEFIQFEFLPETAKVIGEFLLDSLSETR